MDLNNIRGKSIQNIFFFCARKSVKYKYVCISVNLPSFLRKRNKRRLGGFQLVLETFQGLWMLKVGFKEVAEALQGVSGGRAFQET